jgi:hypothetical protein
MLLQASPGKAMAPVAVLVDGDNLSGKHAVRIREIASDRGSPTVLRVYADAQRASDWHGGHGYRLMHAGTGKNASDLLLALDAMELALTKRIGRFVIASSDGDFVHLAQRLREFGAEVTGVGEAKSPPVFRAACDSFVEIGLPPAVRLLHSAAPGSDIDRKLRALIAEHGSPAAGLPLGTLGVLMHTRHGVRPGTLGASGWRSYLEARPALFVLDPRGPEARVRSADTDIARTA